MPLSVMAEAGQNGPDEFVGAGRLPGFAERVHVMDIFGKRVHNIAFSRHVILIAWHTGLQCSNLVHIYLTSTDYK